MGLINTKGKLEQAADAVDLGHILKSAARSTLESALDRPVVANGGNGSVAVERATSPLKTASKPGLILAGTVAGLTAASAAVSAVRRRAQES